MSQIKPLKKYLFIFLLTSIFVVYISCKKETAKNKDEVSNKILQQQNRMNSKIDISGQVKLADSQVYEGIIVYAAGTTYSARTNDKGEFVFSDMPVGKYQFIAEKYGYQSEKFHIVDVEQEKTAEGSPILLETLILQPIKQDSPQQAPQLANFTGHAALEGESKHDGIIVRIKGTSIKTVTDYIGEYNFQNLNPGTYSLVFSYDKFKSEEYSQQIEAGDNIQLKEVITLKRVDFPEGNRKISGTVDIYDVNGNLLNNFSDVIVSLEGTSFMAAPDSSGKFVISGVPSGIYTVNATAAKFINRNKIEVDLIKNDSITVSLYLDEKKPEEGFGTISGNVKFTDSSLDASNISIALAGTSFVGVPNTNGEFKLTNIPVGTYSFVARADGFISAKIENIEVSENDNTNIGNITLEKRIEPPTIQATDPYDGQDNVIIRAKVPISIRFSKKMRPETVKKAFSINPPVEYSAYMAREHPQSDYDLLYVILMGHSTQTPLRFKTEYTVTINTNAQDFEGANLEDIYSFSFKTVSAAIIKTFPQTGDRNAFLNEGNPVTVFFNTKIKYDTFKSENIVIDPAPRATIRTFFRDDPESGWTEAYIYTSWEFDKNYTITLNRGIRTSTGESLSNTPYRIKFKTAKMIEAQPGFENK